MSIIIEDEYLEFLSLHQFV